MTEEIKKVQDSLEAKFKKTEDALAELRENGASKEKLQEAIKAVETQGKILQDFIQSQNAKKIETLQDMFSGWLQENKDEIRSIYQKGSGTIEFNPFEDAYKAEKLAEREAAKAVGTITTGSGSNVGTPPHVLHAQLGSFNLRNDNDMLGLCTITSTNQAALTYTEMLPKEGSYAFVAESGSKPQIDFSWVTRFVTPRKAAAHEILTEEAVTDFARLESVAKEYLAKKHDLFKVNGVYFGDGTGQNPTGATVAGRTFVAGGLAGGLANGTANIMDVINACATDIYVTANFTDEEHYEANIAMMNPVDYALNFVMAKDADGLPLYPTASLFNRVSIGGMTIIPWIKIPAGKIFVADMKKYNVVNYVPFSIRIGWINTQFITNEFTMVGESRFHTYIKNLDLNAFIYDDIATVVTAIEAI